MSFEYEGEYWFDPAIGKLRPRWAWPCAEAGNPDSEYILGHMHKATSGPGSGKLVPRYQGSDILGSPAIGEDCPGGNWTGYNKKVDGKLRPYLTLPGDSVDDVSSECGCAVIGYDCVSCEAPGCSGHASDPCTFNWEPGEAPAYIQATYSNIELCENAFYYGVGYDPEVEEPKQFSPIINTSFVMTQLYWWRDTDPGTFPPIFLDMPIFLANSECVWAYVDDVANLVSVFHFTGLFLIRPFLQLFRLADISDWNSGSQHYFDTSNLTRWCQTVMDNRFTACGHPAVFSKWGTAGLSIV